MIVMLARARSVIVLVTMFATRAGIRVRKWNREYSKIAGVQRVDSKVVHEAQAGI